MEASISLENAVTPDCVHLEQLAGSDNPTTALRARIVLLSQKGYGTAEIASALGVSRKTVWRWRTRFDKGGLEEVTKIPRRSGRRPTVRRSVESKIIDTTMNQPPTQGRRWTTRLLAQTLGVSRAMVHRVWKEAGITPPVVERPPIHFGNGIPGAAPAINGIAVALGVQ